MSFTFTLPQSVVTGSPTPHTAGPFTPAAGDTIFAVQLDMPNADFETAGNTVTLAVQRHDNNALVSGQTWASTGAPLVHNGVTDPPPLMRFDLTQYIGVALDVLVTIPQTMTIGFTVTGS